MGKDLSKNLLLLVLSFTFIFLILEGTLRLLKQDRYFWEYNEEFGVSHVPGKTGWWCSSEYCNKFEINNQGMVDDEISEKNGKRILLFGDSFMEALQVNPEDSLQRKLEYLTGAEVLNFGVSGYGPTQYLMGLKKWGPIYHPDLVIFAIFVGNDLRNINPDLEKDNCKPYLIDGEIKYPTCPATPWYKRLAKKSVLVNYIYSSMHKHSRLAEISGDTGIPIDYLVFEQNNSEYDNSYDTLEDILLESKEVSDSLGSQFMVFLIGSIEQISDERWEQTLETYPDLRDKAVDLNLPNVRIRDICERDDLSCLDLLSSFREAGSTTHYELDAHWNSEGHALGANLVSSFINDNNLLTTNTAP